MLKGKYVVSPQRRKGRKGEINFSFLLRGQKGKKSRCIVRQIIRARARTDFHFPSTQRKMKKSISLRSLRLCGEHDSKFDVPYSIQKEKRIRLHLAGIDHGPDPEPDDAGPGDGLFCQPSVFGQTPDDGQGSFRHFKTGPVFVQNQRRATGSDH